MTPDPIKPDIYSQFFETVTADTPLEAYRRIYTDDAHFKDPFHETHGVEKIYTIFQKMFRSLDNPRFTIVETAQNASHLFVVWEFHFGFRSQAKSFEGMSRLTLDNEGKIRSHVDFWDASEPIYGEIPLLGWLIRYVRNQIAA